jgi:hypothetical protein
MMALMEVAGEALLMEILKSNMLSLSTLLLEFLI